MINRNIYSRVGWRKYLDPTNKPRVSNFIKSCGNNVFTQIVKAIDTAIDENLSEIILLVHPNVSSVVIIEKNNYDEVLIHCLNYFKSIENYEQCANIIKIKNKQHSSETSTIYNTSLQK